MPPRKKNKKLRKEEICEDYCFACKDGGEVRICDYKDCLKVYHPHCVGKDDSFLKSKVRWTCNRHSCFMCRKTVKFHCFCCPQAVCGRCLCDSEFVVVKGNEGFCNHCLKLVVLIEEKLDVDSDGGTVDFKERNTFEYLFKEYWEIMKEKQGLSAEHVSLAKALFKSGKNYSCDIDSIEIGKTEESFSESDEESDYDDDWKDREEYTPIGKKKSSKGNRSTNKRKVKAKKIEFIGWGSECLLSFLASTGKDTSKELSQNEVTSIVTNYCRENNLFDPQRRKIIVCDDLLKSLFGKKSTSINRIYTLLSPHFADNLESSEDDETGSSSEDDRQNFMLTFKRQNKLMSDGPQKKKELPDVQKSCLASVIPQNIKLVYLRRSLVEELLKQPENFDEKVVGSFVRVKSNPNDYAQKNSHQLLQVQGIKKTSTSGEMDTIFLQLSNMPKDVPVCKLSNDDFSEDECKDLHQRVKDGLLKKPTVVELEQVARRLHRDRMKQWIARQLCLLQKRIDQANEKGRRRELDLYVDQKLLLETPAEQTRLLNEVPEVIADIERFEPTPENSPSHDKQESDGLPEALKVSSQTPSSCLANRRRCYLKGGMYTTDRAKFGSTLGNSANQDNQEHDGSPESAIIGPSQTHSTDLANRTLCHQIGRTDPADKEEFGSTLGGSLNQDKEHDGLPEVVKVSSQTPLKGPSQTPSTVTNGTLGCPNERTDPADRAKFGFTLENSANHDNQEHDGSPESAIKGPSQTHSTDLANQTLCHQIGRTDPADKEEFGSTLEGSPNQDKEHDGLPEALKVSSQTPMKGPSQTPSTETNGTLGCPNERTDPAEVQGGIPISKAVIIDLSDEDEAVKGDPGSALWHCMSPLGETRGPFKMSLLKHWRETSDGKLQFKVWRKGQSKEEAIFLIDAIRQSFPGVDMPVDRNFMKK